MHADIKLNNYQIIQWIILSLLTYTNLIVHESLQALNEFMLVPFINILLPEKQDKKKKKCRIVIT